MPLTSNTFRFGPFALDVRAAELQTNGSKVKIPEQPFQVLTALLEHATCYLHSFQTAAPSVSS